MSGEIRLQVLGAQSGIFAGSGLFVLSFGYIFFYDVLLTNPTDVSRKFNMMKSDMDYMLGIGGNIVFRKDVNRGSVASLTRNIAADSWTDQLFDNYQTALQSRGWEERSHTDNEKWEACKLGALATLDKKAEFFPALSATTYGVRFEYSAASINECGP
ncbi:hypothetical protein [Caballeronia sp. LZ001]|uniref:hypothetical protein n=1 Tax=Caballeronia sp. LZ001 TaxID=3038553 RepID=UPI0028659015|nr:hypothetical protein [Caballeronia sp. LZ001]MDR5802256.1 hypothetical protein [Caballeronia sp. LZ001]